VADIPAISGPDTGTWKSILNTIIGLINGKINSRPYQWANSTARLAQTGMVLGELGLQADTQVTYRALTATTTQPWNSPWITYTATLTGFAVGTGGSALNSTRYRYVNGEIEVDAKFVFGTSGTTFPTSPTFTLPVTAATVKHNNMIYAPGGGSVNDATGSPYSSIVHAPVAAVDKVTVAPNPGAASIGNYTTTSPFTWAAGDTIACRFMMTPA
jgi:hypothetical protein